MKRNGLAYVLVIAAIIILVIGGAILFFLYYTGTISAYMKEKRTIGNADIHYADHRSSLTSNIMALDPDLTPTAALNDLANFDWDKVYFFEAYSAAVLIEDVIGIEWYRFSDSVTEGDTPVVFLNKDKIVCYCTGTYKPEYHFRFRAYMAEHDLHYFMATPEDNLEFSVARVELAPGEYVYYLECIG